jgi:hypothetical protein
MKAVLRLCLTLIISICAQSLLFAQQQSPDQNPPAKESRAYLQKQLDNQMNRLEEAKNRLKSYQESKIQLENAKQNLSTLKLEPVPEHVITELKASIKKLQGFKNQNSKNKNFSQKYVDEAYSPFYFSVEALDHVIYEYSNNIRGKFMSLVRGNQYNVYLPSVEKNLQQENIDKVFSRQPLQAILPKAYVFYRKIKDYGFNLMTMATDIDESAAEIYKFSKADVEAWVNSSLSKLKDLADQINKSLESDIAQQNAIIAEYDKAVKNLNNKLEKLEQEQSDAQSKQIGINEKLVLAVFGMIGAIVILFIVLRMCPENLAIAIVNERTMIELLSMGFLLLTVIILGTARLLGNEALSALLGTIAGYIFGRKEADRQKGGATMRQPLGPGIGSQPIIGNLNQQSPLPKIPP